VLLEMALGYGMGTGDGFSAIFDARNVGTVNSVFLHRQKNGCQIGPALADVRL
jgi:hypothetical protein